MFIHQREGQFGWSCLLSFFIVFPFICYYWGIPPKLSVGGLGQRVLRRHSLVLLMSVFSLAGAFLIGSFLRSLGPLLYRSLFKSRCSLKMKSFLYGHLQLSPCCLLSSPCCATTGHLSHSQTLECFLKNIPPGDLPDQESNLGLLHCRQILYHLSHQGSPCILNVKKESPE